jgi:hypothetical protein
MKQIPTRGAINIWMLNTERKGGGQYICDHATLSTTKSSPSIPDLPPHIHIVTTLHLYRSIHCLHFRQFRPSVIFLLLALEVLTFVRT